MDKKQEKRFMVFFRKFQEEYIKAFREAAHGTPAQIAKFEALAMVNYELLKVIEGA